MNRDADEERIMREAFDTANKAVVTHRRSVSLACATYLIANTTVAPGDGGIRATPNDVVRAAKVFDEYLRDG